MRKLLTIAMVATLGTRLAACSVPVSYYALMRWPAAEHRIEGGAAQLPETANAVAEEGAAGRLRAFFPGQELAWWDAPLTGDASTALKSLCDSPLRRELVRRLASADAAVWILLESGDAERDAAAATLVQKRLDLVAKTAQLPEAAAGGAETEILVPELPPRIAFTLLRLRRGDPAEAALQAQLLHVEKGLDQALEPMAFAVFGRGRVLPPLHGPSLDESTVDEVCLFLVGSCSCEIKEQNPGVDLLLAVDWDAAIAQAERDVVKQAEAKKPAEDAKPEVGRKSASGAAVAGAEVLEGETKSALSAAPGRGRAMMMAGFAAIAVGVMAGTLLRARRQGRSKADP